MGLSNRLRAGFVGAALTASALGLPGCNEELAQAENTNTGSKNPVTQKAEKPAVNVIPVANQNDGANKAPAPAKEFQKNAPAEKPMTPAETIELAEKRERVQGQINELRELEQKWEKVGKDSRALKKEIEELEKIDKALREAEERAKKSEADLEAELEKGRQLDKKNAALDKSLEKRIDDRGATGKINEYFKTHPDGVAIVIYKGTTEKEEDSLLWANLYVNSLDKRNISNDVFVKHMKNDGRKHGVIEFIVHNKRGEHLKSAYPFSDVDKRDEQYNAFIKLLNRIYAEHPHLKQNAVAVKQTPSP